ncbi:MAG: hypothetical protein E7350_03585 [Clostridiales bacterium]|nr:hypothetical protein [Clostridiales bacterium]
MKKIACLILCLMLSMLTLCSCSSTYENSFIKHNYERDYAQTIITIDPITEEGYLADDSTKKWTYTSDAINISKSQLVSYINNYGGMYSQYYGWTTNQIIDYFVEQLVLTELVLTEADIKFEAHEIFWSKEDITAVQTSVYNSLDSMLSSIYNEILEKAGRDTFPEAEEEAEEEAEPTYPVRKEEEPEAERIFVTYGEGDSGVNNKQHDAWYLDSTWEIEDENNRNSLPGNYGNADTKSLAREGVLRLISSLAEAAENLINVTEEEADQIAQEVDDLREMCQSKGVAYAYQALGKTVLCKKLYGDAAIKAQKMTILESYIVEDVTVSEEEILAKYNKMLAEQVNSFATESNYDTAATGDDLVLFRANGNYVYVKHILLPFSDEQTEYLASYKEIHTEDEYLAERDRMVNNIVAYQHVDGEDDTTRPLTVAQIFSEVKASMSRASASAYDAERTFDDLIYKYNTDPGSFGNEKGYAVKYSLNSGESETYMVEFAEAARAFRDEGYKVGEIYDDYIVTDYGVHIMYYAADYVGGEILNLNDYTTAGRYTLVKDIIEEDLLEEAKQEEFSVWQDERIYYYRNVKDIVTTIEKAFKDLYVEE